jgi:hypothetical protein
VDTRTKIVSAGRAAELARSGATVVSGYFDPLIAAFADELAGLKRPGSPLVVLIRSTGQAILPARARAELVAALAVVDYVCDAESNVESLLESATHLEGEHDRRLKELVAHVHARQKAAASDPHSPQGGGRNR